MSTKDTKATKATKAAQVIELIKYIKQERAAKKKALEELNQSQGPLKKRASEPDQKKGKQEAPGTTETVPKEVTAPADEKTTLVTSSLPITQGESGHATSEAVSATIAEHPKENGKDLNQQALEAPKKDEAKDAHHDDGKNAHHDDEKDAHHDDGKDAHHQEYKDLHQQGKDKDLHQQVKENDLHQQVKENDLHQQGKDKDLDQQEKGTLQQEGSDAHHQEDLLSKNARQPEEKNPHRQENKEKDLYRQSEGHNSHHQYNKDSHNQPEDDHKQKEDIKSDHADHEDDTNKHSSSHTKTSSSNGIPFSSITKQIEAVITDTATSTSQVFNAATTSFFEGYGIAAGHAEDEFGGLGLIGVFEDVASIGIKSSQDQLYILMTLFLVSWFVFRR